MVRRETAGSARQRGVAEAESAVVRWHGVIRPHLYVAGREASEDVGQEHVVLENAAR